jgi:hypothetical protein
MAGPWVIRFADAVHHLISFGSGGDCILFDYDYRQGLLDLPGRFAPASTFKSLPFASCPVVKPALKISC